MRTLNKGTAHKKCRGALMVAAVTTVPFIAALSAGVSAPAAAAAEVDYFGPEPATVLTIALFRNGGDQDELGGLLCESPRTCVSVPFPYLQRSIGVKDLDEAIHGDTFGQRQIVFGYSQGARVATDWLEEFATAEDAPSPDDLSFVLIGNPGRKHGGAHVIWGQPTPDSQYQVLDVAQQYDLTADRPDRFSLLAMANAYAGLIQLHGHYENVDIYDPANYVWKEGNTTYVFVPTEDLPILNGLRRLGLDELADQLQGPLKEKIEKAYDRSYLPAEPGWPAEEEPEPEEPPVEPPAEPEQTFLTSARSVQTISAEEPTARQESDPDPDVDSLGADDELGARIDEADGQPADDA
ncbi:MAG: PE-PPE domain-containing protein, partial [Dietzia sp.]|nr:PE-PPE domain-containing protein [Dietzia sp.]